MEDRLDYQAESGWTAVSSTYFENHCILNQNNATKYADEISALLCCKTIKDKQQFEEDIVFMKRVYLGLGSQILDYNELVSYLKKNKNDVMAFLYYYNSLSFKKMQQNIPVLVIHGQPWQFLCFWRVLKKKILIVVAVAAAVVAEAAVEAAEAVVVINVAK